MVYGGGGCSCFWFPWDISENETRHDLIVDPDCDKCFPCTCVVGERDPSCKRHGTPLRLGFKPMAIRMVK